MSARNVDKYNRFRNVAVCFRVSPEEADLLNRAVALSGLSKYEYCYRKCTNKDVVVQGNIKIYKMIKDQLAYVLEELKRIDSGQDVSGDLKELITLINNTVYGLKG